MKNILIIATLFFSSVLYGQQRLIDKNLYQSPSDIHFHQIIATPNAALDSFRVIYFYAFKYNALIFYKIDAEDEYYAIPEFETTFKDSEQITRKRLLIKDTIWAESFDETINKEKIYSNFSVFSIPISDYKITASLLNCKYGKNITYYDKIEKTDSNLFSKPLFLSPWNEPGETNLSTDGEYTSFSLFAANNYIPFEESVFTCFIPTNDNTKNNYWYHISKLPPSNTKSQLYDWGEFIEPTGECTIQQGWFQVFEDNKVIYFRGTNSSNLEHYTKYFNNKFISFTLSMATFTPGEYVLSIANNPIYNNKNTESIIHKDTFIVKWNSIPNALLNPEYAGEQMYPILNDNEYKQLMDGNKEEIFNNIMKYWKKNDPTPATEYNEKMTTYFNRVDAAQTLYQTIVQKQGVKTDRGKVFILNGVADEITSDIKNKKSYEIWKYNKLRKIYKFEIVSVGNYVLVNEATY